MAERPEAVGLHGCRAKVVRGPDKDGRWYWRITENPGRRHVWAGWATSREVEDKIAERRTLRVQSQVAQQIACLRPFHQFDRLRCLFRN